MDAGQSPADSERSVEQRIPAQRVPPDAGATGSAPSPVLPAVPPPLLPAVAPAVSPAVAPVRKLRLVLAVLAGVVILLCVGGSGVAFVAYQRAVEPDRSAPDVVVSNYLRAFFTDRNDASASLFTCKEPALREIHALRDDIESREGRYSIKIAVNWGELTVQEDGDGTTVTTGITRTVGDGSERDVNTWRFDVVDSDGWRVCGAHRLS